MKKSKDSKQKLKIRCRGNGTLSIDLLTPLQGALKHLTEENYERLKKELSSDGFIEPISVWENPEDAKLYILNGHQRVDALRRMRDDEGWVVPQIPVNMVEATTLKEAKRFILALASQYGTVSAKGVSSFIEGMDFSLEDFDKHFSMPELDLGEVVFGDPIMVSAHERSRLKGDDDDEENSEPVYTKKVDAPIYTPRGECPSVEQIYDESKTDVLSDEIVSSDIPDEVKKFLLAAAQRHTVFDYQKIAEFYAHADRDTQRLMEKSALVIIDFDKAIENGFVTLTKDLADAYAREENG